MKQVFSDIYEAMMEKNGNSYTWGGFLGGGLNKWAVLAWLVIGLWPSLLGQFCISDQGEEKIGITC